MMLIRELSRQESLDLLARSRLGRLACARGAMPYIVPLYFAYDDEYLYSFSTFGQKIEWMRDNPNVCVEVDEVANPQQWVSVVIFGQFEEMPDLPEWHARSRICPQKTFGTQLYLVGARLRENDRRRYRTPAGPAASTAFTSNRLQVIVPPLSM